MSVIHKIKFSIRQNRVKNKISLRNISHYSVRVLVAIGLKINKMLKFLILSRQESNKEKMKRTIKLGKHNDCLAAQSKIDICTTLTGEKEDLCTIRNV